MSTNQKAVMLYGWKIKAGMDFLQVNRVLPHRSALKNAVGI